MVLRFAQYGAAPPAGLLDLCRRDPTFCGPRAAPVAAAGSTNAAMFHALIAAQRAERDPPPAAAALTTERWRLLDQVNYAVNAAIRYAPDSAIWGQEERWALPLSRPGGRGFGDCEDFALEKREALIRAGWPVADLSLVTAIAPRYGMHAVLIAHTAQGDFVLDNFADAPRPLAGVPYRWLTAQRGADLMHWRGVEGAVAAPLGPYAAGR